MIRRNMFYKLILFYLLSVSSVIHAFDIEDFTENEQFVAIIGCLKHIMNNGIDELDIPPFAKFEFPDGMNFTLNEDMAEGDFSFTNVVIKGFSDFDVTSLILSITLDSPIVVKLTYQFKLYGISLSTQYDVSSRFFNLVDVIGIGIINSKFAFDFDGFVVLEIGEILAIDDFKIFPKIYPEFDITGLSVGKRLSRLISRQIVSIIETIFKPKEFRFFFNDTIGEIIKLFLKGYIELPEWDVMWDIIKKECNIEDVFPDLISQISAHVQSNRKEVKTDL